MSTDKQIDSNRTNAEDSTGPITEAGKQIVSTNATRHGLLSQRAVLHGESHEEFLELLTSLYDEHKPQTPTEYSLVESMTLARWRQHRLWSLETAGLSERIRNFTFPGNDEPFAETAWLAFRALTDQTRSLELLNRYDIRFEREFRHNLNCLRHLRESSKAKPKPVAKSRSRFGKSTEPKPECRLWWTDENGSTLEAGPEPTPEKLALFGKFTPADWKKYEEEKAKEEN
jgi:hypothetical protein